jgi:hypothetical protein
MLLRERLDQRHVPREATIVRHREKLFDNVLNARKVPPEILGKPLRNGKEVC